MTAELLEVRCLSRICRVDVDGVAVDEGEVLTTLRELAVGDGADRDGFGFGDGVAGEIHEANAVGEADEKMETGGVKGESAGFGGEVLDDFTGVILKIPDADGVVEGAGRHQGFARADIETDDRSGVIGLGDVVELRNFTGAGPVDLEGNAVDLVGGSCDDEGFFRGGEGHGDDGAAARDVGEGNIAADSGVGDESANAAVVVAIIRRVEDVNRAAVASANKTLGHSLNRVDGASIGNGSGEHADEFAVFNKGEITNICSDDDSRLCNPSVAREVVCLRLTQRASRTKITICVMIKTKETSTRNNNSKTIFWINRNFCY